MTATTAAFAGLDREPRRMTGTAPANGHAGAIRIPRP